MRIQGIDHVEYYVGDLATSAGNMCESFGFRVTGLPVPGGPQSMLLRYGQIHLLLTAPGSDGDRAAQYLGRHGDGVGVIAFRVDDVARAFDEVVAAGARPVAGPVFTGPPGDRVGVAEVGGFGDVTHKLIERESSAGEVGAGEVGAGEVDAAQFAPGTVTMTAAADDDGLLAALDHVAVCLPAGQLDATVAYYRDVFGLAQIFDERIEVGGQAMLSKVVQDPQRNATFTLIEPDLALEPSQIDEFLEAHGGAGVQHLALRTTDIIGAVSTLAGRGVGFLDAPEGYYRALEARLGELAIPAAELRALNVLADCDPWGQMFQIFARSTHERRTFFFELIERRGGRTFGTSNIQALYEALDEARAGAAQHT